MILLPLSEVTAGMVCAQEIRMPNNMLLIARGTSLTEASLRHIRASGIETICIEQEGTEDIEATPLLAPKLRIQCETTLQHALKGFQRSVESKHLSFDTRSISDVADTLVEEVLGNQSTVLTILDLQQHQDRLFQHSLSTALLATLLARKLGQSASACKQLALGMLFHDCGQLLLPHEPFNKAGELTAEEWDIIRQHPRKGFEQVQRLQTVSAVSANIILRHHERLDGTGYPDGVGGKDLSLLARIASVVEAFDSMTSLRAHSRAMPADQAMRTILGMVDTAYDRQVVLALVQHVAIYPPGMAVRLSTGERGLVISNTSGAPTRPKVRLFYGAHGDRITVAELDLTQAKDRKIVQCGLSLEAVKE